MTLQWAWGRSEAPATPVFVQLFVLPNIKEITSAQIIGPLRRESIGDWWIPLTKGQ